MENKRIRRNIFDLHSNYPLEFAKFVLALDSLQKSPDWSRICGIHGITFNYKDSQVLCPTDPKIISKLTGFEEPQYCPHGVKQFLIWHTIYLLEFEFLLNKYAPDNFCIGDFISLPWLDIPNIKNNNCDFLTEYKITIQTDINKFITITNPLAKGNIYRYGSIVNTTRRGYLNTNSFNTAQQNHMASVNLDFHNSLNITNYESLSSMDIPKTRHNILNYVPLETPHNQCHTSVGGKGGSLSNITTASHDPIFWLHHCNVDRYFYNWIVLKTNNFTQQLTFQEILPETLELTLMPFNSFDNNNNLNGILSDDWENYNFCWRNNTGKYLKIADIIDLSIFQYKYEIIPPLKNLIWVPKFYELVGIRIPRESLQIYLYIVPKHINISAINIDKTQYLAGIACWIGIDREEIYCHRCEKTRTNININISHYLLENKINKKNIKNYNLILEGEGLSKLDSNGNSRIYTHAEILTDGKAVLILDEDDIIQTRDFKFQEKYIHTKFIQSIISKLNKLGYIPENTTNNNFNNFNWEQLINIKNKFESDWGMDLQDIIKMKQLDIKLTNSIINSNDNQFDTTNVIMILKNKIKNILENNLDDLEIKFKLENFEPQYKILIYKCIDEWDRTFNIVSDKIKFIEVNDLDIIPDILFRFLPIDGEYQICGSTWVKNDLIYIDIDSDENYTDTEGLFELVIKHEMGHALGLSHSNNKKSIMFPFVNSLDKSIHIVDIHNVLT